MVLRSSNRMCLLGQPALSMTSGPACAAIFNLDENEHGCKLLQKDTRAAHDLTQAARLAACPAAPAEQQSRGGGLLLPPCSHPGTMLFRSGPGLQTGTRAPGSPLGAHQFDAGWGLTAISSLLPASPGHSPALTIGIVPVRLEVELHLEMAGKQLLNELMELLTPRRKGVVLMQPVRGRRCGVRV